ncbi:MAG: type I methionyl aminopeptidase [Chloroflexota bacterium]|nr:type I methionyl aminopeptidase [Chloroflexota bacterium]MDE2839078.1 type I methionyl aminopeptidase [Chloroflexota bacterium]MDE2929782.1 type I methionyl aminopeptidase [Chloroflexota bacterium]
MTQAIQLKTPRQLRIMRQAGKIVAEVLALLGEHIVPGATTAALDALAEAEIKKRGAVPSFKGYHGYPCTICASVNEQIVHGIPGEYRLQEGDILSIDVGAIYKGWHGDSAVTYAVGRPSAEAERVMDATQEALRRGIAAAVPDNHLGDIGFAIQSWVEAQGFAVVRDFVGHGIGRVMHEAPQVPNFGEAGAGIKLRPGMAIAIEPMVSVGDWRVKVLDDGWTAVTADGSLSAHYEHSIAITSNGPEILTSVV